MPTTAHRGAFLALILMVAGASLADARRHPSIPAQTAGPQRMVTDEGLFNCGTYRENWKESLWHHQRHKAFKRDIALGRLAPRTAASYIHDDVWVVEDDGTLLLSGTNTFDTQSVTIRYTPNGNGGYDVEMRPITIAINFDTELVLGDDTESIQSLQFPFNFFGAGWSEIHIGSNGNIAFGGNANPSGFFDSNDFFGATPQIAAYHMDLDPGAAFANGVFFHTAPDSFVITWIDIPEFNSSRSNSFQVVMRSDGSYDVSFSSLHSVGGLGSSTVTVGLTPGGGAPNLDRINFSADLPYSSATATGVYEDYMTFANPKVVETALGSAFLANFPDEFFQYVFFTNFTQTMGGFANELNIENSVTGIGLPIFDNSGLYGSNGILESRCNMSSVTVWPLDPTSRFLGTAQQSFLTVMGQESGHRWGAFVRFMNSGSQISNLILGRSDAHWSFYLDVDHSCLEGGQWEEIGTNFYRCPTYVDLFSDLDEYLMGLRTAEEVSPLFYVSSSSNNLPTNRDNPPPAPGNTASGTPVVVTIDDIIAAEGPRTPLEPNEEKDLRQGFIFLLQGGSTAQQSDLDKLAGFRRAWEDYFELACDGRLTVNTSVTQTYEAAALEGMVRDRLTTQPVANLTVTSNPRGFVQEVPAGGRYAFRYLENENSDAAESMEITFSAPGYFPKTIQANILYGYEARCDHTLDPVPTHVTPERALPNRLYQNYPNPFNPSTTISFDLTSKTPVSLRVYDVRGRLVTTLIDGVEPAGHSAVEWDGLAASGEPVASGVYIYKLVAGDFVEIRKMHLLK